MADTIYEVEEILESSSIEDTNYYLVRWKGFSSEWDTWEPEVNLTECDKVISKFKAKIRQKSGPKSPSKNQIQMKVEAKSSNKTPVKSKEPKNATDISSSVKNRRLSVLKLSDSSKKMKNDTKPFEVSQKMKKKESISPTKNILKEDFKKKVKKKENTEEDLKLRKKDLNNKPVENKSPKKLNDSMKPSKKVNKTPERKKKTVKVKLATHPLTAKWKNKQGKGGKNKETVVKKAIKKAQNVKAKFANKGDQEFTLDNIIDFVAKNACEKNVKCEKKGKLDLTARVKISDILQKKGSLNSVVKYQKKESKVKSFKRKYDENITITDQSDSDDETLYSVSIGNKKQKTDKSSSQKKNGSSPDVKNGKKSSPKMKALVAANRSGSNSGVESVKRKLEVKPIRVKPFNSPTDKSPPSSAKKKMRLIDSMKDKSIVNVIRPVSPTPVFTAFRPLNATESGIITVASASASSVTPLECGDVPVYNFTPSQLPISRSSMSYQSLLDSLPSQIQVKKTSKTKRDGDGVQEEERERIERRISVRQSECAFRYKEIAVRKCQRYTQIWLNSQTKLKNALNPQVIQEVISALNSAKYDDSNLVMYSGLGNIFCSGIDLNFLISGDRKVAVRQMVDALRDFTKALITFPKPIVAVVNGPAIGLGMSMLPLCDIVYASDKATFYLPYAQLSQTPEGCASFSLPQSVGMAMANELLIGGRRITAIEACNLGLVSQVFWPTSMMQEVIPKVQNIALHSAKALETTKLLVRCHQRTKLELTNESESNLLMERWQSIECQKAIENFLNNENNFSL